MKRFTMLFAFFVLTGSFLYAQGVLITGNVTGADDATPLPGVSVVVQGTTIGTVTDYEGNYSITVPNATATLVFSFVGMITQDLTLAGQTVVDAVLESSTTELDEGVEPLSSRLRAEKSLGYNVQSVDAEEISKANTSDVVNAISGRTAGVTVTSS